MSPAPHRRWLGLLIVAIATALVTFSLAAFEVVVWDGHKTLEVQVQVLDTDVPEAVPGAQVTIFDGPQTPFEGAISGRKQSDFAPDPQSSLTETRVTNSDGVCRFSYPFMAGGRNGLFGHSGAVYISRVWLRVSAPDRPAALVPVDRQSIGGRDIDDGTPLVVTVVLNKCPSE